MRYPGPGLKRGQAHGTESKQKNPEPVISQIIDKLKHINQSQQWRDGELEREREREREQGRSSSHKPSVSSIPLLSAPFSPAVSGLTANEAEARPSSQQSPHHPPGQKFGAPHCQIPTPTLFSYPLVTITTQPAYDNPTGGADLDSDGIQMDLCFEQKSGSAGNSSPCYPGHFLSGRKQEVGPLTRREAPAVFSGGAADRAQRLTLGDTDES
ncbi:hypothetical protein DNTS_024184 [Danionella cerebrum]|uniref:Uncharacterized protein n=1 Tax=Danionella cerebrum TaxID=2873325 RepID=A0A553RIL4_9TELE|nr:hypothetical protein DNTS_024184 [Danionella translucida]